MVKYIIKRVLLGILTLFVLIAITFAMTKVMPGSPLQSKNISGDVLKKMEATYGLDKPPVEQFIIYCKNLLHGDMGTSYKKVGKSVNEIIAQTMMPTLQLGIVTFVLVLVVGVSSGILMARAKSNAVKGVWLSALTFGVSVPNFIVAASQTPHSEILAEAAKTLKKQGYDLKVTVFDDYVQPNNVVESGEFDANYVEHKK